MASIRARVRWPLPSCPVPAAPTSLMTLWKLGIVDGRQCLECLLDIYRQAEADMDWPQEDIGVFLYKSHCDGGLPSAKVLCSVKEKTTLLQSSVVIYGLLTLCQRPQLCREILVRVRCTIYQSRSQQHWRTFICPILSMWRKRLDMSAFFVRCQDVNQESLHLQIGASIKRQRVWPCSSRHYTSWWQNTLCHRQCHRLDPRPGCRLIFEEPFAPLLPSILLPLWAFNSLCLQSTYSQCQQ